MFISHHQEVPVIENENCEEKVEDDANFSIIEEETPPTLEQIEKDAVVAALKRAKGKRHLAAAELNISERTLYRKIRDYNLDA
jgi:transcriptional regulator of acetoin/glycerol metabolism